MKILNSSIIKILKNGGVGVLPTDTLYGLVGSALSKKTVERIYKLKKRNFKKPFIILISSINDLKIFEIKVDENIKKFLRKRKTSIILSCSVKKYKYLHRGKKSLAFRIPHKQNLIKLLKKVGPLVVPSANLENKIPAYNIIQAQKYFGDQVDFYINEGIKKSFPSRLIIIENQQVITKRKAK